MKRTALRSLALLTVLIGGCIVSDQLTTITIHPDGSADVFVVQSNVHSNQTGAEADEELRRYVEEFNAQKGEDHVRIAEAGGQVQESRWIRSERPYANLILYKLPSAAALEKAFTFKGEKGDSLVTARLTRDGARRKLSLLVTLPAEHVVDPPAEQSIQELRASQANGLSEMRIALSRGNVVSARYFTIAADKQSALLEPSAILEVLRSQKELEAYLEWEIVD